MNDEDFYDGEDEYYVCNHNDNDYDDDYGNNHAIVLLLLTFLPLYLK